MKKDVHVDDDKRPLKLGQSEKGERTNDDNQPNLNDGVSDASQRPEELDSEWLKRVGRERILADAKTAEERTRRNAEIRQHAINQTDKGRF